MTGWERDQSEQSSDVVGRRANFEAYLAFAESRWADVIASTNLAEQRFAFDRRPAAVIRGFAYQALGQADSAIASFEGKLSNGG